MPGKIVGNIKAELYDFVIGFSLIFQDWSIRLGLRLVWHEILSVCFIGLQRDHPENPYERAGGTTRYCEHDRK